MNTISNSMVHMAMDGQALYKSNNIKNTGSTNSQIKMEPVAPTGAEVAQNIEKSLEEIKADTKQLERMSEMVEGRKLQFNVNKELGSVVVKIIDSDTNQILKEIPSKEIQNLKMRIRKAIGTIFNEIV